MRFRSSKQVKSCYEQTTVHKNPAEIGPERCGRGQKLLVIAGPCVIENGTLTLTIAERLADIARELPIQLVFKEEFEKANRTSLSAYRGSGMEVGLKALAKVGEVTGLPVTTDIHEPDQAATVGEVCTLLQLQALLSSQTELLVAAAQKGQAVHGTKGTF